MEHVLDNGVCVSCQGPSRHRMTNGVCSCGDEPLDENSAALLQALNEIDHHVARAWSAEQAAKHIRNPKGSPGGGRFRSNVDRLKDAIAEHKAGTGEGHPFDGFDREQLRKVAKARGIEMKRGESRDSIAKRLLDHLDENKPAGAAKQEPPSPGRDADQIPWLHDNARDVQLAMNRARKDGDGALAEIVKRQGFDAPPRVVDRSEMDRLIRSGHTELWRGVDPNLSMYNSGMTGREMNEQLKRGRFFPGFGLYGNGTYTSVDRRVADVYGGIREDGFSRDNVVRMTIEPHARIVDRDQLLKERDAYLGTIGGDEAKVLADEGRFAAARGYDVVRVRRESDGSEILNPETGRDDFDQYVILNRGVLIVQEETP